MLAALSDRCSPKRETTSTTWRAPGRKSITSLRADPAQGTTSAARKIGQELPAIEGAFLRRIPRGRGAYLPGSATISAATVCAGGISFLSTGNTLTAQPWQKDISQQMRAIVGEKASRTTSCQGRPAGGKSRFCRSTPFFWVERKVPSRLGENSPTNQKSSFLERKFLLALWNEKFAH